MMCEIEPEPENEELIIDLIDAVRYLAAVEIQHGDTDDAEDNLEECRAAVLARMKSDKT